MSDIILVAFPAVYIHKLFGMCVTNTLSQMLIELRRERLDNMRWPHVLMGSAASLA